MLHYLARQWMLVWRQPMRLFGRISRSPRCAVGDDFMIVSVFSASRFDSGYMLLTVHIVVGFVPVYSAMLGSTLDTSFAAIFGEFLLSTCIGGLRILRFILVLPCLRIQFYAWFDRGYKFVSVYGVFHIRELVDYGS